MKLLGIVLLAVGMSGCSGCVKSSDSEQAEQADAGHAYKGPAPADSTIMFHGQPVKVMGTVPRDRRFDHGPNANPK